MYCCCLLTHACTVCSTGGQFAGESGEGKVLIIQYCQSAGYKQTNPKAYKACSMSACLADADKFVQLFCECCVQDEMLMLVSHPVSISDLEWQDPNASTDVVLAMGGMSIKKASQHSREHGLKSKSQGTQSAESGNADSMFAWLSKLLPGL